MTVRSVTSSIIKILSMVNVHSPGRLTSRRVERRKPTSRLTFHRADIEQSKHDKIDSNLNNLVAYYLMILIIIINVIIIIMNKSICIYTVCKRVRHHGAYRITILIRIQRKYWVQWQCVFRGVPITIPTIIQYHTITTVAL